MSSDSLLQWLQSICPPVLNRRSTAAELGKVEFALVKEEISFT